MTPDTRRDSRAYIKLIVAAGLLATTTGWPARSAAPVSNAAAADLAAYRVTADGIPEPIDAASGDARRGRALILAREAANCLLCHGLSDPDVRFAGNLGPSLDGIAMKLSTAQLRLRVVDNFRRDPATIMPSYYRVDNLDRVAAAYRGKPILAPGQVEDIVAYLATLR